MSYRTPLTLNEIAGALFNRKILTLAIILTVIAVGEGAFRLMPPSFSATEVLRLTAADGAVAGDEAFYAEAGVITGDALLHDLVSKPASPTIQEVEQNLNVRILNEKREFEVIYTSASADMAERVVSNFTRLYRNADRKAVAGSKTPVSIIEAGRHISQVEYLPLWLRIAILAVAGFFSALFFAWYLEWRNPKIRSARVLHAKFGLEVLAELSE